MIEGSITLNPFGCGLNVREISKLFIANTLKPVDEYDSYVYLIHTPESSFNAEEKLHGVVYHKREESISKLIRAVYLDNGMSSCDESEKYVLFWLKG